MGIYRNTQWRFELTLPQGWKGPGFMQRLLRGYDYANPEFYGPNEAIRVRYSDESRDPPNEASIKFAIGPISTEPTVKQHQRNLEVIARRHRHCVRDTGIITILGKDHATMVYEVPRPSFEDVLVYRFKNYHLVFNGIEYVVTTKLATLPKAYWPPELTDYTIPPNRRYSTRVTNLQAVYMYEQDYDDIMYTFRLIG